MVVAGGPIRDGIAGEGLVVNGRWDRGAEGKLEGVVVN